MNKLKNTYRILTLILALALVTVFPSGLASAQAGDYSEAAEILTAVGFIDGADQMELCTREEAVSLTMRLIGFEPISGDYKNQFIDVTAENPNAPLLAMAVKMGICEPLRPAVFAPRGSVHIADAEKMIMKALGYDTAVSTASYLSAAQKYLKKGISIEGGRPLTKGELYQLILNAAQMPIPVIRSVEAEGGYYKVSDDTDAFYVYHRIRKLEGTVTANSYSGLYNKKSLPENRIAIDGTEVKYEGALDATDLLGRGVEAYCRYDEDEDSYTLLHCAYADDYVKFESADITSFSNNTYKVEPGGKTSRYSFDKNAAIIYNGVAIDDSDHKLLTSALFQPENGIVELIATEGGEYNVVKISDYKTYVVESIDRVNRIIVDRYEEKPLTADFEADLLVFGKTGEPLTIDSIEQGNVVSVAQSADKSLTELTLCSEGVQGTLISIDGNKKVEVEGEYFELTPSLSKYVSKTANKYMLSNMLGGDVILYLDHSGRAAHITAGSDGEWSFGYLIDTAITGSMEKVMKCKLLTQQGEVITCDFIKTPAIDGKIYKDVETAKDYFPDEGCVVRYRFNDDGALAKVDSPVKGERESENTLHQTFKGNTIYKSTIPSFGGASIPKNNVIIFNVPEVDVVNPEDRDYQVADYSIFTNDRYFDIETFAVDAEELADDVVLYRSEAAKQIKTSELMTVYEKMTTVLTDNGEELRTLHGQNSSGSKEFLCEDEIYATIAAMKLKPGDLLRITPDNNGYIQQIERGFSADKMQIDTSVADSIYNGEFRLSYGKALARSGGAFQMKLDGSGELEKYKEEGIVYIVENGKVSKGSYDDIIFDRSATASSNIVVEMNWSRVRSVVIYR